MDHSAASKWTLCIVSKRSKTNLWGGGGRGFFANPSPLPPQRGLPGTSRPAPVRYRGSQDASEERAGGRAHFPLLTLPSVWRTCPLAERAGRLMRRRIEREGRAGSLICSRLSTFQLAMSVNHLPDAAASQCTPLTTGGLRRQSKSRCRCHPDHATCVPGLVIELGSPREGPDSPGGQLVCHVK